MNSAWLAWAIKHLADAPAFAAVVAGFKNVKDSDTACDYVSGLAMALKPILHDAPINHPAVSVSAADAAEHIATVLPVDHPARALGDGHLIDSLTKLLPLIVQIVGLFRK